MCVAVWGISGMCVAVCGGSGFLHVIDHRPLGDGRVDYFFAVLRILVKCFRIVDLLSYKSKVRSNWRK
jgi:hypothetical protein